VVKKINAHIPTVLECNVCHTSTTFFTVWAMNHSGLTSGCASCHAGQYPGVVTKSTTHLNTSAACENCHTSTSSFLGATFNHSGTTSGCANCHDGRQALGKSAAHIPTTAACEICHTATSTFSLWNMNHAGITSNCVVCHSGQYAGVKAKSSSHMATTAACEACHGNKFTTFLGATSAHTSTPSGSCYNCHGGGAAGGFGTGGGKGMSNGHIPTGKIECGMSCHTYTAFSGATMNHSVVASLRCDTCHNGAYTTQGKTGAQSLTTINNHIPTKITATLDCNTCHTSTTNWLNERMNHNGATGRGAGGIYCVTCHLGSAFYMGNMYRTSHRGASTSKDCTACHTVSYSRWSGGD
jgi:hypothetical protein